MNYSKINIMFLSLILCLSAHAETIKVTKIKGNKAIVEFTGNLQPEMTYTISNKKSLSTSTDETTTSTSRKNLIGITGIISSLQKTTSGVNTNRNIYYFAGSYGWNTGTFEYGPSFSYGSSDTGSGATTTYSLGGFFDWNFQPNTVENKMIYGAGINAQYASSTPPNGATATTANNLYPSVFLKWFILDTPVALRLDAGYRYLTESTGSITSTTTGFDIEAGFSIYF